MTREFSGCLVFFINRNKLSELVQKIVTDREAVKSTDWHWILTQKHCKREAIALALITIAFILAFLFVGFVMNLVSPNQFHAPFNFNIVGLPDSHPFISWLINYANQLYWIVFLYLCYLLKFDTTMIIMNHSCWLIDSTLVFADALDESLIQDNESSSIATVAEHLRKIRNMVEAIVDWQQRACRLFALNFLGIFLLQATGNCLIFFLLSNNTSNSYFPIYALILLMNEIFVYCWMGSRVVSRLEKLVFTLQCLKWDLMKPRQRKDLVLILLMSQNIQTYHGVFRPVNFETFKAVRSLNILSTGIKAKFPNSRSSNSTIRSLQFCLQQKMGTKTKIQKSSTLNNVNYQQIET